MSFDKIFDLTAGVYFYFYNNRLLRSLPTLSNERAGTTVRSEYQSLGVGSDSSYVGQKGSGALIENTPAWRGGEHG